MKTIIKKFIIKQKTNNYRNLYLFFKTQNSYVYKNALRYI